MPTENEQNYVFDRDFVLRHPDDTIIVNNNNKIINYYIPTSVIIDEWILQNGDNIKEVYYLIHEKSKLKFNLDKNKFKLENNNLFKIEYNNDNFKIIEIK